MTRFLFSSLERSLQQGAVANAAAAVHQNRLHAEQKRVAAQAQAQAQAAHGASPASDHRSAG
jgi:hypothetical protein